MMKRKIIGAALALGIMAQPCAAQTQTQPAAPSQADPANDILRAVQADLRTEVTPARLEAARRFMRAAHVDEHMSALAGAMMPQIMQLVAHGTELPADRVQAVTDIVTDLLRSHIPQLTEMEAHVYAVHFSEDDLNAFAEFYSTPAGQHLIAQQNDLSREGLALGNIWAQQMGPELEARIAAMSAQPQQQHP
jgi:hypothetical protein